MYSADNLLSCWVVVTYNATLTLRYHCKATIILSHTAWPANVKFNGWQEHIFTTDYLCDLVNNTNDVMKMETKLLLPVDRKLLASGHYCYSITIFKLFFWYWSFSLFTENINWFPNSVYPLASPTSAYWHMPSSVCFNNFSLISISCQLLS